MNATAIIPTLSAKHYLGLFVSHYAQNHPAMREADNSQGEVSFTAGLCTLDADARKLSIIVNAGNAADLSELKNAVNGLLRHFALQEELRIAWQ